MNYRWTSKTINTQNWGSKGCSQDGRHIYMGAYAGYIYISHDFGRNFTKRTDLGTFNAQNQDVICSDDGKIVVFTKENAYPIISRDYGNTFSTLMSSNSKQFGATFDMKTMITSNSTWNGSAYMNISKDYGNTWTQLTGAGNRQWYSFSLSKTGKYICACVYKGDVYVSTDGGDSWSAKVLTGNWNGTSVSEDGKVMMAVSENAGSRAGQIWISKDYGNTWSQLSNAPVINHPRARTSKDGRKIITYDQSNSPYKVYLSTNYGNTWLHIYNFGVGGGALMTFNDLKGIYHINYNYSSGSNIFRTGEAVLKKQSKILPSYFYTTPLFNSHFSRRKLL